MTDQSDRPPDEEAELEELSETDLGEPLAELYDLSWPSGDDFGRRVNGRIERRLLAGRLLDVAWSAPLMVIIELLRAPFELFSSGRRAK